MVQILDGVKAARHRAILTTCYAAGLRISEAVRLTVSAIDSQRMVLRIAKGKGEKDCRVMLSPRRLAILRDWWKVERPRHWLFPGERPEAPITRAAVQRACQIAARRARLAKAVSPHALRPNAGSRIIPSCSPRMGGARALRDIEQCRTAALGGHVEQCDHCGHRRVWYNSCRNRHCPTCQSLARATWLDRRRADLLPSEYFHVVFTVPPAVDGDRIRDRATYERPRQPSEGTVNGRFAVQDGDATGALAGRSIRRP